MFISIYFKTSSCGSDPEINTFIYGPPPSINCAPVSSPQCTACDWTHVSRAPALCLSLFLPSVSLCCGRQLGTRVLDWLLVTILQLSLWSRDPLSLVSSPSFHLPAHARDKQLYAVIHEKQVHSWRRRNERSTCKTNAKAA